MKGCRNALDCCLFDWLLQEGGWVVSAGGLCFLGMNDHMKLAT